jgi:hypothetical protein
MKITLRVHIPSLYAFHVCIIIHATMVVVAIEEESLSSENIIHAGSIFIGVG